LYPSFFIIPLLPGEDILKKIYLPFLLLLMSNRTAPAADIYAYGINDPSEYWSSFYANTTDIYQGVYLGYSEFNISVEYVMCANWWGARPSDQPFRFIMTLYMPNDAIIVQTSIRTETAWIEASPQDVLTAETLFNDADKSKPRCLLRQQVFREYDGSTWSRFQLEISPIYYEKPFALSITYLQKNYLLLDYAYASVTSSNLISYWDDRPISYNFLDVQHPDNQPVFTDQTSAYRFPPFAKLPSGWWRTSYQGRSSWGSLDIRWPNPAEDTPQLACYLDGNDGYYQITSLPPVQPSERTPKKILVLYDLGLDNDDRYDRDFVLDHFADISRRSLASVDSINVLVIDQLQPKYLRERFIPASTENTTNLIAAMRNYPIPQMSALPQLLRSATAFFNRERTDGEIWLITDSERDAYPVAKANDMIALSLDSLEHAVKIKILACGNPYRGQSYYINGRYYRGNDYLFENLTRLTGGGLVRTDNLGQYQLSLALADLFSPALDLMEIDPFPAGGYCSGRYKFHPERSHYPVLFPYIEMGRVIGHTPFTTDFYGNVDGEWYHKQIPVRDTLYLAQVKQLKTLWHAQHVKELLKQPQAWGLIDEIGRISKENHFVSPYCGFVVPSAEGYAAFKRLEKTDSLALEADEPVKPGRFDLAAYPNPFNAQTQILLNGVSSDQDKRVTIRIFTVLGRMIRAWQQLLPAGESSLHLTWNGEDDQYESVGTGLYFVQVRWGGQTRIIKITCLK